MTPLSAWFLLVLGVVGIPVALYSIGYLAHAVRPSRTAAVGVAFNVLIAAVSVVFVVNNVIGFLFAWEIMTLATAALVATEHETRTTLRAAYLYLVMSHVGTGALVAAFFTLASASGSMSFSAILTGDVVSGPLRDVLFGLFFFGFGVKAGVIPLHVWLPEAHPAAPSSISALMSAVLIKAGIYGLFRVCAFGLGTPAVAWGLTFVGVGTLSAILGVLYALMQNDLKRLLAYSTIENAGIILLGLGAGMTMLATGRPELAVVAIAASLYHVLNHAAFKGLLFLGAGSVVMATGTRQIEAMGGLLRRMPWTGVVLSRRRPRDLGSATAQRLRQRMAHVPGAAARVRVRPGTHARELPAGRRAPGADQCARRRLLRQGVRHHVPRAAAHRGRGGGARITGDDARAAGAPRRRLSRTGAVSRIGSDGSRTA